MRYSQLLAPTVKEVPAEAEVPSHQLMIRAGFIRKLASGTYAYLPLGWRCLKKIIEIVRREMDAAGAQEVLLPVVQPIELWRKTGRDVDYGETMARFTDRHGRVNVIGPTAEEVVTHIAAGEIRSYKQLPINLYQISFKFRDEFRPRFGVLRSREFLMKDAYSFNADAGSLEKSYREMYDAYRRIFDRCGLDYVIVEAESGEMGGVGSHQFTVPCHSGEDVIVRTADGSYAANLEKAAIDPPAKQPAPAHLPEMPPEMEEVHTPAVGSIEAVCGLLGTAPQELIKTLVYSAGERTVICLVRGDHEINTEKLTQAVGGVHVALAEESTIEKITGAGVGFAGPVALREQPGLVLIDHAVAAMAVAVTGANKTDYHVRNVVPGRDFPLEGDNVLVADIRNAVAGDMHDGKELVFQRGIEVGQLFKLGTKYATKLGCTFLDESGSARPCMMGCYGIGINRILASAIEIGHDDNGCILPINIAPFEVEVVPVNAAAAVVAEAELIYRQLSDAGIDVLIDDRSARPGVKFKDADLIGIPVRVVVGERGLKDDNVEVKRRTDATATAVATGEAVAAVEKIVKQMRNG